MFMSGDICNIMDNSSFKIKSHISIPPPLTRLTGFSHWKTQYRTQYNFISNIRKWTGLKISTEAETVTECNVIKWQQMFSLLDGFI